MTRIKINTWIETHKHRFDSMGWEEFTIELKPFYYKGELISGIKVEKGNKEDFKKFLPLFEQSGSLSWSAVEIELDDRYIYVKRPAAGFGSNNYLVVRGENGGRDLKSIEKWELPTSFRFGGITGMDDSRDGILRLKIMETDIGQGPMTYFSPKVNYVEIPVGKDRVGDYDLYFNNAEHRLDEDTYGTPENKNNSEVIIENIEWEAHGGGQNVTLKDGKLVIGSNAQKGVKPKIRMMHESKNFPHPDTKQASKTKAVKERVSNAVRRADKFSINREKQLFKWGYTNNNKEDFQEAVQAMSDLIKLAKNGSEEEKEEYKTYLDWQIDYFEPNSFSNLKGTIQQTAEVQGWKYDLEKGEVDWGSIDQEENNQNKGNESDKKRKNEDDNDSRESKRLKGETEEIKDKVKQESVKKDEQAGIKLANDLQELSSEDGDKKEQVLANIERLKSEGKTYEEQKEKVAEKKDELAKSDPVGYGKMIARIIQQKIDKFKVEVSKLGQEISNKFNKLKNGEFTNDKEVRQVEEEVSDKVSGEVANIELNSLMAQAQKVLEGSIDNLQNQLKKVREGLYSFSISSNSFQQSVYQQQKSKVEKMLKDLENHSSGKAQSVSPKDNFPLVPIVIGGFALILLIGSAIVIRNRRIRKQK